MTTPQNQLYNISQRLAYLIQLFEKEEDAESIFEEVAQINKTTHELIKNMLIIQDQMSLIIKLLNKEVTNN